MKNACLPVALSLFLNFSAGQNSDPAAANLVTDDLVRFWQAYDQDAPYFSADTFQEVYLEPGSKGLNGFMEGRIESAGNLVLTIRNHRAYYASLHSQTERLLEMEPAIRASFYTLQELYPEAVFPDVYFVVGALNSGGTATQDGLIIGMEMFGLTDSTPLEELDSWLKSVIKPLDQLPHVVAHELVHFQQFYKESDLLYQSIIEGAADFVGELISGGNSNEAVHTYANPREEALWREFERVMHGSSTSGWLYDGGNAQERPADLGYWMGYKIVAAYYDKAPDKQQAVADIIQMKDADAFLEASGYAEKFR